MKPAGVLAALALLAAAPAAAEEAWPARAAGDVEAAYRLLLENHPATAAEMHDADFTGRLEAAHDQAKARAAEVKDFKGYVDTLRDFGEALGDPHLTWAPQASTAGQAPRYARPPTGQAGFGVKPIAGGWWIGAYAFDRRVLPVIQTASVTPDLADGVVVFDFRGNSGGDSTLGDRLVALAVGQARLDAVVRTPLAACRRSAWRASPGNLATLEGYPARMAESNPAGARQAEAQAAELRKAVAEGRAFSTEIPAACLDQPQPSLPAERDPRLFVITDAACMSSCLIVVDHLLRLGATQLGHKTQAGNWYMESRMADLPSGLGRFGLVQKVGLGSPRQLGPYVPHRRFDGDIRDTAALEGWVQGLIAEGR